MSARSGATPEDLQKRLNRIEGQVRGVAKMIEAERDCREIVQQLTAIRSALQQVSLLVVRDYAADCLLTPAAGKDSAEKLDSLIDVLSKTT